MKFLKFFSILLVLSFFEFSKNLKKKYFKILLYLILSYIIIFKIQKNTESLSISSENILLKKNYIIYKLLYFKISHKIMTFKTYFKTIKNNEVVVYRFIIF